MIRFLFRFLGLLLLALAFIFVVYDGVVSISASSFIFTKAGSLWAATHERSMQGLQALVEQYAGAEAWQIGVSAILDQPASALFCVLGIVLIVLGRKKRPLIGYARD